MIFDKETMRVKLCKECKGLGKIDEDTVCPNCGGTGRLICEKHDSEYPMSALNSGTIVFDPESMKIKICKECKGLGYFVNSDGSKTECHECKGFGRIVGYKNDIERTMSEFKEFDAQQ